jgi:hypothetical protein
MSGRDVPGHDPPCSLLGASQCENTLGCYANGDCSGTPYSCLSYDYLPTSCSYHDGCYYSYSSDYCNGTPYSCGGYADVYGCEGQDGCYWQDSCDGVAFSCSSLTVEDCTEQPGCSLQ